MTKKEKNRMYPHCPECGGVNLEWFVDGGGRCDDCASALMVVNGYMTEQGHFNIALKYLEEEND